MTTRGSIFICRYGVSFRPPLTRCTGFGVPRWPAQGAVARVEYSVEYQRVWGQYPQTLPLEPVR